MILPELFKFSPGTTLYFLVPIDSHYLTSNLGLQPSNLAFAVLYGQKVPLSNSKLEVIVPVCFKFKLQFVLGYVQLL